jgi:hypothetical protein
MNQNIIRRKRKRKATSEGRFLNSTVAYELGLVRLALEAEREFIREQNQEKNSK